MSNDLLFSKSTCLRELNLQDLNKQNFSVYIIDYDWLYLFVNDFARARLGGIEIQGKKIEQVSQQFPMVSFQNVYKSLKEAVEARVHISTKCISPITQRMIEIKGHPLSDCYYFSVSEVPDRDELISELRTILKSK